MDIVIILIGAKMINLLVMVYLYHVLIIKLVK